MDTNSHIIDPRTTRRTIPLAFYESNSAYYATYEKIGETEVAGRACAVLQRKVAYCQKKMEKRT